MAYLIPVDANLQKELILNNRIEKIVILMESDFLYLL